MFSVGLVFLLVLAGIIAAGALYQTIGAARDARTCVPSGRMIDVRGGRLHVVCAGSGAPAVVFESGIAASSLSWTRVVPAVAAFTQACAYDRAGLGWSEAAGGPRTLARMIDELHEMVARAGIAAPQVLVGHSFGAFLVCAYASRHPDRIAA